MSRRQKQQDRSREKKRSKVKLERRAAPAGYAAVNIDGQSTTVPMDSTWAPVVKRLETRTDPAAAKLELQMRARQQKVDLAVQARAQKIAAAAQENAAKREYLLAMQSLKGGQKLQKQQQPLTYKLAAGAQKYAFGGEKIAGKLAKQAAAYQFKEGQSASAREFIERQLQPAPAAELVPATSPATALLPAAVTPEGQEPFGPAAGEESEGSWWQMEESAQIPESAGEQMFDELPAGEPDEEAAGDDAGEAGPAWPQDELPAGEEGFEGLGDPITAAVLLRWNELVGWLKAKASQFLALKTRILLAQQKLDIAIANAERTGRGDVDRLEELRERTADAMDEQRSLETKVTEWLARIGVTQKPQGLGVAPIVIGAAAVAALAFITGAVYLQMRSWEQTDKEIDLVTRGLISVGDLERIKRAGAADPLGLSNAKPLAVIALAGLALWVLPQIFKRSAPA
jgi:hypothetical protein